MIELNDLEEICCSTEILRVNGNNIYTIGTFVHNKDGLDDFFWASAKRPDNMESNMIYLSLSKPEYVVNIERYFPKEYKEELMEILKNGI